MSAYDDASRALYQVPLGTFVEERKRLAAELKAAGEKAGATKLGKLARPPVSAWAVNQLYWHARDTVDRVFAAATKLRDGDLSATSEHREALAAVRMRAATLLADAGHTANETTLRRVALTMSALAAAGSWAPDAPGELGTDRDPPGFDAVGVINAPTAPLPAKPVEKPFPFAKAAEPAAEEDAPPPPSPPPSPARLAPLPPTPGAASSGEPKISALDELRARRKQVAAEAAEENRRRFIEDGGTRDAVISKRMSEAQDRNSKQHAVEVMVANKLAAQQIAMPPPSTAMLTAAELLGSLPPREAEASPAAPEPKPTPVITPKPAANDGETDVDRRKKAARAKLRIEIHARLDAANSALVAFEQRVGQLTSELAVARDAFEETRSLVDELRDQLDALE